MISPVAALLDLSATIHSKLPAGFPTPSAVLRTLGAVLPHSRAPSAHGSALQDSSFDSMARALTIPPVHVDHVAEAICIAADNARADLRGPFGVKEIRELIGWHQKGQTASVHV